MIHIVYVLVSNSSDFFLEMFYLSASCLKKFTPNIKITILCNQATHETFTDNRANLANIADHISIVNTPAHFTEAEASRFIKTSIGNYIDGDFLFLDIDAFPIRNISSIYEKSGNISLAYEMNLEPDQYTPERYESDIFKMMGWDFPTPYFNGGVMLVKASSQTCQFFKIWHDLWLHTKETGNHKDQPSMHQAIKLSQLKVIPLNWEFNILTNLTPRKKFRQPKIFHISTVRFQERDDTLFHGLIKSIKNGNPIDWGLIDKIRDSNYPWNDGGTIKRGWVANNCRMMFAGTIKKLHLK